MLDSFSARMKGYESVSQSILMHRTPVIVRVDGKNFSNLTRGMEKPFDRQFAQCMKVVAMRLASEAQNCCFVYHQSDEVSLLLIDFRSLTSEAWFGNQVQKICSISAALATSAFIEMFIKLFPEHVLVGKLPVFDARCFNLPREEVTNYFVWRQRDAERNRMIDMLMSQKGINWDDYDALFKRGAVITKKIAHSNVMHDVVRMNWSDADAPIFAQERDFIEKFLREEEVRT
jgi:tRNA(His) 5'-end guanylyltransferase